jgi:hypothetical protein
LNTIDVRAEKTFPLSAGRRVAVFVDGFNLGNQGIPDPSARPTVREISGQAFGIPLTWLTPRSARAGVRVAF